MSQIRDLDNVIRRVPEGTKADGRTQVIVTIDGNNGNIAGNGGLFGFNRNYIKFLVSNRIDANNVARGVVHFTYRESLSASNTVDIDLFYEATCSAGNEGKVAQALYAGPHPAAVLNSLITTWVQEYILSRHISLIQSYIHSKSEMEKYVSEKALEVVGLDLTADLVIPGFPNSQEVTITDYFPVRFKRFDSEHDLSVHLELEIDQRHIVQAILYKNIPLGELIRREIRKYFAANVSLHQFYFSLNDSRLRESIKNHLEISLNPVGRTITFISLERDMTIPVPPMSFSSEYSIPYKITENSPATMITSKVLLELQDAAKYEIAGSPNLYQWVKEHLEAALRRELFNATYLDLLLRFDSFKKPVLQSMSQEASLIGYDIKHLITDPNMEPKIWLKGIEIKTTETEEEFETKVSKFPVRLSILVNTRIKDLKGVEQYLNPLQDVPALMKKAILDETARFLRTVDPKTFHLGFSVATEPNELPLEEKLRKKISKLLKADFKVEDLQIILREEETEIGALFQALHNKVSQFEVKVASRNPDQPEDIVVRGTFTVEALDYNGWEKFRSRKPGIADIKNLLEDSIKTHLENYANTCVKFKTPDEIESVSEISRSSARQIILEHYGLEVSIDNIGRNSTPFEIWLNSKSLESVKERVNRAIEARKQMEDQLWALKLERFGRIAVGESEAGIKNIDKRIELLENEIINVETSVKRLLLSSSNSDGHRAVLPEQAEVRQLYGPSVQASYDDGKESKNDNPSR
jgi:hypothetical protein